MYITPDKGLDKTFLKAGEEVLIYRSRWEGDWTIQEVKSAVTMKITNGHHSKVVHVNRLRHRFQKQPEEIEEPQGKGEASWAPPEIEHLIIPSDPP